MNNPKEQEESKDAQFREKGRRGPYCWPAGMADMKAKCCEGMAVEGAESMAGMMATCCKPMTRACRWLLLIPVVLAGAAFLLGYYLSPTAVRVLWLVIAGAMVLLTCLGVILAKVICRA